MNAVFIKPKTKEEQNNLFMDLIHFLERCQRTGFMNLWKNHISFQATSGMNVMEVSLCLKGLFSYLRSHKHLLNGNHGEWCIDELGNRFVDMLLYDKIVRFNFYSRKLNSDFPAFKVKDKAYYAFTIETDVPKEEKTQ